MSCATTCPECDSVLDFEDEKKTWRARCPKCGAGFIANESDLSAFHGMLPLVSGFCILGLPFGIWTLQVLNKPHDRAAFDQRAMNSEDS